MNLNFKISIDKNKTNNIDTSKPFEESLDEYQKYAFTFSLNVYKGKNKVAIVSGYVMDEDKIINDNQDLLGIADMYEGTFAEAIEILSNNTIYEEEIEDNFINVSWFICYIERFYVFPKYRKQGIGKYLLTNLSEILGHFLNAPIRCFVTFINPQTLTAKGWEFTEPKDEIIKKVMIKLFKEVGYKEIDNSDYFAINCMNNK